MQCPSKVLVKGPIFELAPIPLEATS